MSHADGRAVALGAGVAVAVGAGAAVVGGLSDAAAHDASPLTELLVAVALAGLATGGWVAARTTRRAPLTHGVAAALAAVVVLVVVELVRAVAGDGDVHWASLATWALLAVGCGIGGGLTALHGLRGDGRPTPDGAHGPVP